jgi:Putative peptidoglycan binding domain
LIVALSALVTVLAARSTPAHSAPSKTKRAAARHGRRARNPFSGRAMWIWELGSSSGGDATAIATRARASGIGTVLIKSSDGTSFWSSQFTPQLVSYLHSQHLRVCAWQYVYGDHPVTEAYMGADAVHDGADCLVIDAESEYEGKYVAAQSYITRLRKLIGNSFPVALAGFPYIDYHPAFPYSVFLGPGGAQYDVPQMYWRDIGTTVNAVYAHTYSYNLIYSHAIAPLGQLWQSPPARQIIHFRQLSRAYGAVGVSWWDWQQASSRSWTAMSRPAGPLPGFVPDETLATITPGTRSDLVVWAQEHLVSAGDPIAISGVYGYHTTLAVQAFQTAHGLTADGVIGPDTWAALLSYAPVHVVWTKTGPKGGQTSTATSSTATATSSSISTSSSSTSSSGTPPGLATIAASAAAAGRLPVYQPIPKSASRRARRNEIPDIGRGRP